MWKTIQKRLNSPDSVLSLVLGFAVILVVGLTVINAVRSFLQKPSTDESKTEATASLGLPVALPTTHTVKQDESLWTISEYYYKSGYNWVDIDAANALEDENYIVPEQKLIIPDVKPRIVDEDTGDVTPLAASTAKPKHTSYTVTDGDNLWDISIKEYDTGYKWPDVARVNSIPNPDLIYPGTILQLQ
jgi:nucleoid-associated protein YgaU